MDNTQFFYLPLAAQAMLLLIGSLIGSCINIPLTVISTDSVMADEMVEVFGMRYPIPPPTDWGGTVLAINVGGAIIPVVMSVFLLIRWQLWFPGLLATAVVSAICYWFSSAIPGMGIAVPVFIPALAATVLALLLSRQSAAPLAYIAGSLGTLIGGDLLNYGQLAELGAPILSIGGAGTFDAVFLTGVIAVLITGISSRPEGTGPTTS